MTGDLLTRLREHKHAILELLTGGDGDTTTPNTGIDGVVSTASIPHGALVAGEPVAVPTVIPSGAESAAIPSGDVAPVVDDLQPQADAPHDENGDGPRAQPQDDSDAADWSGYATPDGRHGWQRCDVAGCEVVDLLPCKVCGGLERWQDLASGWHCEVCSPRTAGPRIMARVAELRQRYTGRARA